MEGMKSRPARDHNVTRHVQTLRVSRQKPEPDFLPPDTGEFRHACRCPSPTPTKEGPLMVCGTCTHIIERRPEWMPSAS